MSLPLKYNFTLTAGDTGYIGFNYLDSDLLPIDLTGCTVTMQLKEKVLNEDYALTAEAEVNANEIRFVIAPFYTADLNNNKKRQKYYYDIEILYPDGNVETVLSGTVTVHADVTN